MQIADFDRLYGALAGQLERIVRSQVRACDAVIDDACQTAWIQLLGHDGRVRTSSSACAGASGSRESRSDTSGPAVSISPAYVRGRHAAARIVRLARSSWRSTVRSVQPVLSAMSA